MKKKNIKINIKVEKYKNNLKRRLSLMNPVCDKMCCSAKYAIKEVFRRIEDKDLLNL